MSEIRFPALGLRFFFCPTLVAKKYFSFLLFNTLKRNTEACQLLKNAAGLKTQTNQMIEDSM